MYALTGDGAYAGRLAEVLLGTLVVALAGLVAWQLAGTAAGLATLGITAVYPPLIVNGASLLSEPLFVVLELGAVACALRWRVRPRWVVGRLDGSPDGPRDTHTTDRGHG